MCPHTISPRRGGPYPDPVLSVDPGDTVAVETHDAFEGAIETEDDLPSEVLGDHLNPQNGPIYVEGATPGDALAITIESIEPRGPQPRGRRVRSPTSAASRRPTGRRCSTIRSRRS